MKMSLVGSLLLLASVSQADIIKCTFSEPWVDSTYSMTQSTLTYSQDIGYGKNKVTVMKNVSFQIKDAGKFELVDKKGNVLQVLTLDNKGSNGQSMDQYPYSVEDSTEILVRGANNGKGGCSSNSLKKIEAPEDQY